MTSDLDDLVAVTDILHQRALDDFRRNSRNVEAIDAELSEIQRLRTEAQADQTSLEARRLLGSDTVWQGWLAGQTTDLQQKKAMARALQLDSLIRAQKTFARTDAASALVQADRKEARSLRQKNEADRLDWLSAQSRWQQNQA